MKAPKIAIGACAAVAAAALTACAEPEPAPAAEPTQGAEQQNPPTEVEVVAEPAAPEAPSRIDVADVGLETPESVLYDADADVYLVSNINGSPFAKDDNGFIAKLSPDGKVVDLKWIDGTSEDFELNAPKGTAIVDGELYVADIDTVRVFDATTGEHVEDIPVRGAKFLNDVAVDPDGVVYVSDTGVKEGFKPIPGKAAIYRIDDDGKVERFAKGKAIGQPNGLLWVDGLWTADMASPAVRKLDAKGKVVAQWDAPKGGLDGIVVTADGSVLVSSWEGQAVYEKKGDEVTERWGGLESPADIGLDPSRNRLLVPIFNGNQVVILAL